MTTWDPANKDASITLSNGNLTATSSFAAWRSAISTGSGMTTGKRYFRAQQNTAGTNFCGVAWCLNTEPTNNLLGNDANGWLGFQNVGGGGQIFHNGGTLANTYPTLVSSGDYHVCAYDATNGAIYFTVMTAAGVLNTNWNNTSANPSTNTGGIAVTLGMALQPGVSFLSAGDSAVLDTTTVISDPTLSGFLPFDGLVLAGPTKIKTIWGTTEISLQSQGATTGPAVLTEGLPFGTVDISQTGGTAITSVQPQGSNDGVTWVNQGSAITAPGLQDLYVGTAPSKYVRFVVNGGDSSSVVNILVSLMGSHG